MVLVAHTCIEVTVIVFKCFVPEGSEPPDVVPEMQKSNDTVDTNESQRQRSVNETEQSNKTGSVMDEFTTSISPPYGEDLEVVTPPTVADVPTVTPSADQGLYLILCAFS